MPKASAILYTRQGCHYLRRCQVDSQRYGVAVNAIDIDTDQDWSSAMASACRSW